MTSTSAMGRMRRTRPFAAAVFDPPVGAVRAATIVGLAAVLSVTLASCASEVAESPAIQPAESDGVHYLVYSADGVLSDAVAYTGVFELDSEGCVVVSIDSPARDYRAALAAEVAVSPDGIAANPEIAHLFGVPVGVGRASPVGIGGETPDDWPECERDLDVFAVIFFG